MPADGSIIIDTEINPKGFESSAAEIKKGLNGLNRGFATLKNSAEKALSGSPRAVSAFQSKAQSAAKTIEELESELQKLGKKPIETEEIKRLDAEIVKVQAHLSKLFAKRRKQEDLDVSRESKSWENLSYDIGATLKQLEGLERRAQEIKDAGKDVTTGADTERYAELSRLLDELKGKYGQLIKQAGEYGTATRQMSGFKASSFSEAFRNAMPITDQFKARIEQVKDAFGRIGAAVANVKAHPLQSLSQALGSLKNGAQYAAKALAKMAGNAIRTGLSKVGSAIKSAGKHLLTFKKNASNLSSPFSALTKKLTGLGSMLKRMLARRFLMSAINGAKEGLQNLAQASPAVNAAMSELKGSLTQLKNSFAAAFAPVLTTVLPVLKTLIGWLVTAANYVAQFFSALSGKKTFTRAVAVQEDYAASLDKTAASAKEAKKELLGFDKITKLQDDSGSGGGGGGGVSPGDMFEETEIQSSIASFVQDLKDAWNAEDFSAVGEIIGNKLNEMVNKVDELIKWDNVGDKITKWVNNIGEVFNSLMDTVDWENIGRTIGDGINTITYSLEAFVDAFDLEKIGTALSDVANSLNNTIDWEAIGRTAAKGLNEITAAINNFAYNTDWKSIGQNLAETANTLVDGLDADALGKSLAAPFKIAFESLGSFVKNFDWAKAGVKLGETINSWFDSIDWRDLAESLSAGIAGAFDTIAKALETIDWQGLAKKTEEFFAGIDWSGMADKLFEAIGAAVGGVGSYIWTLLKDAWQSVKDYFSNYFSWEDTPGEIIAGLFEGIWDAIKGVGTWIKEHIFQPFIDGFKKAFGINSPSTVMKEMGGYLIEGLKNGLGNIWDAIKEKFTALLGKIKDWFTEKKADLVKAWDAFKSGITEVTATLKAKIDETFTKAKEAWSALTEKAKELWANLKGKTEETFTKAKDAWNGLVEKAKDLWANLKGKTEETFSNAKAAWDGLVEKGKDLWAKLFGKKEQSYTDTKTSWDSLADKGKDLWAKIFGKKDNSFDTTKKAYDGISNKDVKVSAKLGDSVQTTAQNWWKKITNWFKGSNEYKADKGKLQVGATQTATKTDAEGWWTKVKNLWGTKKLSMKGEVTEVRLSENAKKQLQGSMSVHISGGGRTTMQTGGIVTHPTRALIGENGPEAVIPLKNNTGWLDIVGKYVVNNLPQLAKGTVVPANYGRMLAVLGDNKRETEVVSPLSTMKKAMVEALQQIGFGQNETQNINLSLNLDGQVIYNEVVKINKRRTRAGGVNPLVV